MTDYLTPAAAYLVGALPVAMAVGRAFGVDLRRAGSGNVGAGNATRTAGLLAGASVAVLDGLKGLVTMLAARALGVPAWALLLSALAVVAGNNWPLGRLGGRGLAVSVGVMVGLEPGLLVWPALWSVVGWRIGGGIAGFLGWGLLPGVALVVGRPGPIVTLTVGLAVFMVLRRAQGNTGFRRSAAVYRILYDAEPDRIGLPEGGDEEARRPRTWRFLVPLGVAMSAYTVGVWWFTRGELLTLSIAGTFLLVAAIGTEFLGKWMFGAMFRDGVRRTGNELSRSTAFRAALVGSGVARLIPAGGAITPVAMSWTAKSEVRGTGGAAVRATALNYGGLLVGTGGALLWVWARHPTSAPREGIATVGSVSLLIGLLVLFGSTRLASLARVLPGRLRDRVTPVLFNEPADVRTLALVAGRIVCETATLGLSLAAFGLHLKPSQTVAAFGAAQIVGGLPGTPGGLGVTEAGLVGGLAVFGIPAAVAFGPVLVFRVVSYWIPAVAGLVAGGFTFLGPRASRRGI
jgi:acyl phosphate:glycerol-3-phosphate acyltransferase